MKSNNDSEYVSFPYILDDFDLEDFLRVATHFGADRYAYVVTPNTDHLIRFHDDPSFRASYADAGYVLLDSRFLSNLFRLFKGIRVRVCTGSDLTAQLFARIIAADDKIVLVGASDEQAQALRHRYALTALCHYNPPMGFINDPKAVAKCVEFVESHSPFRYCFLAVGAPQQEALAALLKARSVARGMALCVGASVNFLTGVERRAPRWMQLMAFEWLYRLACDPKRLAKRYLVRGPRVFSLLRATDVRVMNRTLVNSPLMSTVCTQTQELT